MARKINFRSKIAESLEKGDASTFQSLFKKKLTDSLNEKMIDIISEIASGYNTDESSMVNQIVMAAKSYGGNDPIYELGVLSIMFNSKLGAEQFTEQLDNMDFVDSYEIDTGQVIKAGSSDGANELENADGVSEECDLLIYLDFDSIPMVSDIDGYLSGFNEEVDEGKKCGGDKNKKDKKEESEEKDEGDEEELNESFNFDTILEMSSLQEFLRIKTAHYSNALKRAVKSTDTICPPGRTGVDCKQILTAQEKAALRKRLTLHMKRLSVGRRAKMSKHGAMTRQFIKQNNLMARSAALASVGR